MDTEKAICCRDIMKSDVLDSNGAKVGRIHDFTFQFDKELKLSKFILAGPRWEEILESLRVRPDRDPIFDSSMIKRIDDNVHLDRAIEKLKTTLDKDAIPENDIHYTALEKMSIYDKEGEKIGHTIDIDIDVDGCVSLIVGGSFVEEKLEAIGFKADVDIVVPGYTISSIDDKIQLSVSKHTLETTMEEAIKTEKEVEARESKEVNREVTKVRLFSQRPF